jgi:hypothetical protein
MTDDAFIEQYTSGRIISPKKVSENKLRNWFRDNGIIAGISKSVESGYEFYVPVNYKTDNISTMALVGIQKGDKFSYALTIEQLVLSLSLAFSADVFTINGPESRQADWSDSDHSQDASDDLHRESYTLCKADKTTALGLARMLNQTVTYTKLNGWAFWRTDIFYSWYDIGLLPSELPAFTFISDNVSIQYGFTAQPIIIQQHRPVRITHDITLLRGEQLRFAKRIEKYPLIPDEWLEVLIKRGVLNKDKVDSLITSITALDRSDFISGIVTTFDLPVESTGHIMNNTMPDSAEKAKISSIKAFMMKVVEDKYYTDDPDAGFFRRLAIRINTKPILAWLWIVGELAVGTGMISAGFIIPDIKQWWHILLGVLGLLVILDATGDALMRIYRYRRSL